MSTPALPIVPLVDLVDDEGKANAPEPDSERADELRRERDDAIIEGDLPPPDIAGISEQKRGDKPR